MHLSQTSIGQNEQCTHAAESNKTVKQEGRNKNFYPLSYGQDHKKSLDLEIAIKELLNIRNRSQGQSNRSRKVTYKVE